MSASETGGQPASVNEVLRAELHRLRPAALAHFRPTPQDGDKGERADNLREIYRAIGTLDTNTALPSEQRRGLSALCFSGGGIRSATFNLGVIQGLARLGLLNQFDYLSSVSGGGYIASWLRAWMHREGASAVEEQLGSYHKPRNPLAPEPNAVDRLREYSNYLTPRLGIASPDTWTAAALVIRNLVLNWLVVLPILAILTTAPQFVLLVVLNHEFDDRIGRPLLGLAVGVALFASIATHWLRRFSTLETRPSTYVALCVIPTAAAASLLSTAVLGLDLPWHSENPVATPIDNVNLWTFSLLWCVGIPFAGWLASEVHLLALARRNGRKSVSPLIELTALVVSGVIAAGLLVIAAHVLLPFFYKYPAFFVILAMPSLLGVYLLSRMLFVAFASLSESVRGAPRLDASDDADREWWARLSGWILLIAVSWAVASALCLLGGHALELLEQRYATHATALMGGASGLAAALLQQRAGSDAHTDAPKGKRSIKDWLFAIAAPLFVVCVFIVISRGTAELGALLVGTQDLLAMPRDLHREEKVLPMTYALRFLTVPLLLAAVVLIMGRVVNVNRFSLHGLYRNRLVRAYLGASNAARKPDPFTGFCTSDDLRLHELSASPSFRPMPLINTTLNLVKSGDKLAWQQRKAESFSMTPLYCGNFHEGYRPSSEYGGREGVSLGTAVSISGAAANPSMGSSSSPTVGFLLALFNVRLGAWLGNTNQHGEKTYRLPGPRFAPFPLLAELFGLTTSKSSYVNLSDGGHFDNLGLYEVVLRRCRYVVCSDAGQDPTFGFGDLGNAIRKIRIDFGVPIEFDQAIKILPRSGAMGGLYCATARIRYSVVDGADVPDGILIYLKPTLRAGGRPIPYDVYSYAESVALFPHESTADQWFSESQFESYRALGMHAVAEIGQGKDVKDLAALIELATQYVDQAQEHAKGKVETIGRDEEVKLLGDFLEWLSGHVKLTPEPPQPSEPVAAKVPPVG
ncbi:patatin-like phospholipase family protein [Tahibacter amnicola]|uniref:Patatin-like phospholipase family protein n=1 Tax=Tahibacter amnicola TaxID=2976241 RepID=A0ABY6BFF7_9GAMM|nr:patatin-like phospholipase family protein [Tahibacter amnicola]UXI67346.1 patatin-like phospholipase family protein [Tahibacter amnicola]